MKRPFIILIPLLLTAAGCQHIYVKVDCRLTGNHELWSALNGPRYAIRGVSEEAEASLAFQESADMLAHVLSDARPEIGLKRVGINEPADLIMTMSYKVIDQGMGVETYPVYGPTWSYGRCYGGWGEYYGYAGTAVETYHIGYLHILFVSVWIPEATQPAGRLVLWEATCESLADQRSPKLLMPYLMAALGPYYGQSTDRPDEVKLDSDDHLVKSLRTRIPSTTQSAD